MSSYISISLTKDYIHAVEIAKNGDKLKVKSFKSIKADEPVLKNETVNVETLKNLITQATVGMKSKDVYITAPLTTGVSNEYILPYDKKESHMRAMIWGNISNNLSEEKYLMDYSISSIFTDEGVKKCKVVTYLMPKSIVMEIHNAVLQAGLKPRCFDMPQNAIYKLYKFTIKDETILFANLSSDEVKLHLINPPNSAITRSTFLRDSGMSMLDNENAIHMVAADQVSKMFQFQSIKQPDKEITHIYVFGDLADDSMVDYLNERIETKTSLINISSSKIQLNGADLSRYAYNIGAML